MPFQLSWHLEHRVIVPTSNGESTNQDLLDMDPLVINYFNQCSVPLVHIITDRRNTPPKPSFEAAANIKAATQLKSPQHPRNGWGILVGQTNLLERFVIAVATNFFKVRQRTFNTMDEALDFLNEMDNSLPPLRDIMLDKAS